MSVLILTQFCSCEFLHWNLPRILLLFMHDCSKESRSTSACLWFAKSCELKLRNVPHFQGKELWHWEMPQDMGQPSDVARIIRKGENWIVKSFFDLPSTDFMNITPFQREVVAAVGVFTCRLL